MKVAPDWSHNLVALGGLVRAMALILQVLQLLGLVVIDVLLSLLLTGGITMVTALWRAHIGSLF